MTPIHNLENNLDDDSSFEDALSNALRKFGYLFPESEQELEYLKSVASFGDTDLPQELSDPLEIISRGKITTINKTFPLENEQITENLAMAAREGKEIPREILEQMMFDREKSEEDDTK